ncbi:hypothetical protein ACWIG5_25550 [Streptomyces lydicus]
MLQGIEGIEGIEGIGGIEGGAAAAMRLAGGAPLRGTLDVADPGDWLALDAGVREAAWYRLQRLPEWEHFASLPAGLTQLDESRLALALCHRDGRIRQEAVGRSARYPGLLPLVVIRCADWAGPVRERARQLLYEALDMDSARDLAGLILRVGRAGTGTVVSQRPVRARACLRPVCRTTAGRGNCSTEAGTSSATTHCAGASGRSGWPAEYAGNGSADTGG